MMEFKQFSIEAQNCYGEQITLIFTEVGTASNEAYGCGKDILISIQHADGKSSLYKRFDMRYNYQFYHNELDTFAYWYVCEEWYGLKSQWYTEKGQK